ncbi:MAG: amidohydrolase family protein [Chloroflexota bacterium]
MKLIDCDIHNQLVSLHDLEVYLPDFWCDYINESAFVGPDANDYPASASLTARPETRGNEGCPPGSDLALLRSQLLDKGPVGIGILNCIYWVQSVHHPDLAAALATALNQWQVDEWLEPEPRLRASIVVPSQQPEMAVREIERWGEHPGFVQVLLPVRSDAPYGNRRYDPIYEAASRHQLVVGIHYGGAAGHPPTPAGWPSTFVEEYVDMAQLFQSQVMSLIIEGTFARIPQLRVALLESGFTWMPSLMWRMDKEWKGLRHNIPWVKRPPSAYMREHIRLTTAPLDMPPHTHQLTQILDQMESDEMLIYSSDYPHWHTDEPMDIFTAEISSDVRAKIMAENARNFYRF